MSQQASPAAAPAPTAAPPSVLALPKFQRGDFIGEGIQVVDVLGEGGFGIVYLVASMELHTTFALKTLRGELLRDPKTREMFRKEAQIWIDLGPHPNLVRANWISEISGRLYIGMQYVQSKGGRPNSLEGYLEKRPPSLAQALLWSIQFCHGMEYAVSKGIRCHRDIKPANILIGDDDAVRISDFGIAGLALTPDAPAPEAVPKGAVEAGRTVAGSVFGTPTHMSPEQFRDAASCDERSDVYSFGVVLYQMAANGGLPFLPAPPPPGVDPMAWYWHQFRAMHAGTPPPPLASPLFPTIGRCLAKERSDRYPSFAALRGDLEALYRKESGHEAPEPPKIDETASDLLNRAISLGELGRQAEALEFLDRALAKAPNEATIWNSKGNALRSLGRIDEALGCLDKAIALDSLFAPPWVNKGLIYADAQRNEEALACFDRCLGLSPRDEAAWIGKSVVLGRLGRAGEELACLEKVVEIDPRSNIGWFNMGNVLSTSQRPLEALQAYDRALASDPRYAQAWCGKAIVLGELGRHTDAIAAFDEALRIDPKDGTTWYNKGNVLTQTGRMEDARGCFDQATRIAPEFALAWYNRAIADYQLGDHQRAAAGFGEFLKRAPEQPLAAEARRLSQLIAEGKAPVLRTRIGERELPPERAKDGVSVPDLVMPPVAPPPMKAAAQTGPAPDPSAPAKSGAKSYPPPHKRPEGTIGDWNDRCMEFFGRKQYAEALACTDQGLLLDTRNATTLNNRANCLFFLGKREEALALHCRVLEIQPTFLASWNNKGAIESAIGRKAEAARSLQEILELGRGAETNEVRQARAERAKFEREGVKPAPRGYLGWLGAGYQAMVAGKHADALTCLDNATRLAPENPEVWRWRGDALAEMKRFEEALQNYDAGLERAPKDARLWHDKGRTYVKMRMQNEAIDAFDRSIELDPEYAGAWSDRGKMLGVLKRREEAAESLARAVLLAPFHPAPWQNKALLEDELGREADALRSYREFLKRATPDMRLQVEQAKARIPHLEARLRAAAGDISAPRIDPVPLAAPAKPVQGLPPELAALLGDDFWEGIAPEDVAALRAAAGDPAALDKQIDAMVERAMQGKRMPSADPAAPLPLPSMTPGALAGAALPSMTAPAALKPRTGNPVAKKYAEQGAAALRAGKPGDALPLFDKAIERDGGDPIYWSDRGLALEGLGRETDALQSYDQALALDRKCVAALDNKAGVLHRHGKNKEALTLYANAVAADPKLAASWANYARILNLLDRVAEAANAFLIAVKLDPMAAACWSGLGEALVRHGKPEAALRALDQALALDPKDARTWYQKGNAVGALGKTADAVECYKRAVEIDPKRANAWYNLGHDLVSLKRYADALPALERAIALFPAFDRAFHFKGMALDELGRLDEALQAYDGCLAIDANHSGALNNRGLVLNKLKRHAEALSSFERALALEPAALSSLYNRADTLDKLGRGDEAIAAYDVFLGASRGEKKSLEKIARERLRMLRGEPLSPAVPPTTIPEAQIPDVKPGAPFPDCMKRGEVCLKQGQAEKSLGWFQQAIAGDPRSYNAWTSAAEAYLALKNYPAAVAHLDRALTLNPRFIIGWQRRGAALEALGLYDAALASWDKAIELAPQNLQLWNGRGLALFHLARYEEALASFDKSLALDPRFSLAKFNRAQCEERLARRDEAIKSFQQFLALAPPQLAAQIQEARKKVQELKSA